MTSETLIQIPPSGLLGDLTVPPRARALVVFAHGSGSSRLSSRNRHVAEVLQGGGLATLLMDLLTPGEEEADQRTRHFRFDIDLLAERLVEAVGWCKAQPEIAHLNVGLFGASTGAGAALVAAAREPAGIGAVVSRGGRPDLAGASLPQVQCPVLLLVGSLDEPVIEMNESARDRIRSECRLEIVPGATHLFEEPGTLDEVAIQAKNWFQKHLPR